MSKRKYDIFSGEYLNKTSDSTARDDDSNMIIRIGDSMALDLDSGELRHTSIWDDEDD